MAFVDPSSSFDPNQQQQQLQNGQQQSGSGSSGQPPVLNQSAGSGPQTGPGQSADSGKPTSSGQFVNLQSYLDANSNQNFGGQVAGKVQNEVDQANQTQNTASTNFKGKVDAGSTQYNPDLVNQATTDTVNFAQDPNNVSNFQKQLNARYTGPQNLSSDASDYTNANSATQTASTDASLTGNDSGRAALLQKFYSNPNYTQGQTSLDNLLLSNDPSAQSAFQGVQKSGFNSQNAFQNLQNSLQGYAGTAAQNTANAATQTQNALTGATNAVEDPITARLAQYQKDQAATTAALTSGLKNGDLSGISAPILQDIGLTPGQDVRSYNLNLGSFYTPSTAAALNLNSVSNQDEAAKIAAFSKLAGAPETFLNPNAAVGGASDESKIFGQFNQQGFNTADQAAAAAYNNLLTQNRTSLPDGSAWSTVHPGAPSTLASEIQGLGGAADQAIQQYYGQTNPQANPFMNGTAMDNSAALNAFLAQAGASPGMQNNSNQAFYMNNLKSLADYLSQQEQAQGYNNFLNTTSGPTNNSAVPTFQMTPTGQMISNGRAKM